MDMVINGRTAEDIKARQEACASHASCKVCPYESDETCDVFEVLENARSLIERLESERDAALAKVPKWISVKERLPEENRTVLVYADGCVSISGVYDRDMITGEAVWSYTGLGCAPWYWMPLPEPPKEDARDA